MTITELIAELQRLRNMYGDIQVAFETETEGDPLVRTARLYDYCGEFGKRILLSDC